MVVMASELRIATAMFGSDNSGLCGANRGKKRFIVESIQRRKANQ